MKKKMGWIGAAIAAMSLGVVGVAAAHPGGDGAGRKEHRAEFEARRAEMLARFDANKDGKLDEAERATMHNTMATEHFQKLDTNKDGVISLDEFKAGMKMFHGGRHHGPDGPEGPDGRGPQ